MKKLNQKIKISVVQRELGIDKLTPFAGFVGGLATTGANIDSDKDGQISLIEGANAVQVTAFEAFTLFRGIDKEAMAAQWKDADADEKQQLVAAFAARFDISNDESELLIEDWAAFVLQGYDLVERTVAIVAKNKEAAA